MGCVAMSHDRSRRQAQGSNLPVSVRARNEAWTPPSSEGPPCPPPACPGTPRRGSSIPEPVHIDDPVPPSILGTLRGGPKGDMPSRLRCNGRPGYGARPRRRTCRIWRSAVSPRRAGPRGGPRSRWRRRPCRSRGRLDRLGRPMCPMDLTRVLPSTSSNVCVSGPPCGPTPSTSNMNVHANPFGGSISRYSP